MLLHQKPIPVLSNHLSLSRCRGQAMGQLALGCSWEAWAVFSYTYFVILYTTESILHGPRASPVSLKALFRGLLV